MAQYEIFINPGTKRDAIPFLVAVQNDHIASRTNATVVIPLRANVLPVEVMAPMVEVPGHGAFVLSADEIFAIDSARLKNPVSKSQRRALVSALRDVPTGIFGYGHYFYVSP